MLSQVLRIRHLCSSLPAVSRCAVVCALLVCVGFAQGEQETPLLVLEATQCLSRLVHAHCCCICTQSAIPINPSPAVLCLQFSNAADALHCLPLHHLRHYFLHFDSTAIRLQLEQIQFILVTANDLTQVPHDDFLGELKILLIVLPMPCAAFECLLPSVHP